MMVMPRFVLRTPTSFAQGPQQLFTGVYRSPGLLSKDGLVRESPWRTACAGVLSVVAPGAFAFAGLFFPSHVASSPHFSSVLVSISLSLPSPALVLSEIQGAKSKLLVWEKHTGDLLSFTRIGVCLLESLFYLAVLPG